MKIRKIVFAMLIYILIAIFFQTTNYANTENKQVLEDGVYVIASSANSNYVLDVSGPSMANETNIQLFTKWNTDAQKFKVSYLGDGYYSIISLYSGKALDVAGGRKINGTNVHQYEENGTDAQIWEIVKNEDNTFSIISKCNNLYLDIAGGNINKNVNIQMYEGNKTKAQKFKFISEKKSIKPIEPGEYEIYTGLSDTKVINIANGEKQNEAIANINERANEENQKFIIEYNPEDNTYIFIAKHSNKVLDVKNANKNNATPIWQYTRNNTDAQKWYINPCSNGYYNIISKLNGLYLDVKWGLNQNGQPLQTYDENGTNAQKFCFEKLLNVQKGEKNIPDGSYIINSMVGNNSVLEIPNLSLKNESNIKIGEKNKKANQIFNFKYNNEDGTYTIQVQHSGKFVDTKYGVGQNGTKVQQYDQNGTNAQKWIIIKNSDDTYSVISKCNGLVWDIEGGRNSVGTGLQTYKFNRTNAQKFIFEKYTPEETQQSIEDGTYTIITKAKIDKAIEIDEKITGNKDNLYITQFSSEIQQKFNVEYIENGFYKIVSKKTGKALTVENENLEGSEIIQEEYKQLDTQKWIIKKYSEGEYAIISKSGNLYMDLTNSINNENNIELKKQTDLNEQQFIFIKDENNNFEQIEDGVYKFELKSGRVIDVSTGSQDDFANIQIWNKDNVEQQKFQISKIQGTNYYEIIAVHSAKSINIEAGQETIGTNINQYMPNNSQKWRFKKLENGYYNIVSEKGLVLDVYGGLIDNNGSNVQLYYNNNSDAQKFKLIPTNIIENNTYEIETKLDKNKVLDVSEGGISNYNNIQIWDADNVNQQRFMCNALTTDIYTITAKHSKKVLTTDENKNVYQLDYNGSENQKWKIKTAGNGYYNLISMFNGLTLDVYGGIAINGQNVGIYEQNGTNAQKFKFVSGFRKYYEEGTYGNSGLYYAGDWRASDLKYYKIGKGTSAFFATFSVHGFEDSYDHDGEELTYIANEFKNYLLNNVEENIINNWTIYIFPCVNPDGQKYGYTNNGPGRTTLYSMAPNNKGIDINRNWSIGFNKNYGDRYYNGDEPFQAFESRALRDFILLHQKNRNILTDTHGWLNETIGDESLGSYYRNQFNIIKHIGSYGNGYLINWARTLNNGRSLLVELPEVKSHDEIISYNYVSKYINATLQLLREN